jgi:hypothetical protein
MHCHPPAPYSWHTDDRIVKQGLEHGHGLMIGSLWPESPNSFVPRRKTKSRVANEAQGREQVSVVRYLLVHLVDQLIVNVTRVACLGIVDVDRLNAVGSMPGGRCIPTTSLICRSSCGALLPI